MFSFGLPDFQVPKKAPTPLSFPMEEDAQKRHADCVYFLASPLTCKKGNKCEYRHSEASRANPRDCRFWKSGNCLNPHCPFRHLPLEVNTPGSAISTGTTMPPSVSAKAVAAMAGPIKSKTLCYFFSQGNCVKGDKCTFMHGVPEASSPAEAPADQTSVGGMKAKAVHISCRPLTVLQNDVISEEGRPITIISSEALDEDHPFPSRVSASVPGALKKVAISASFRQHGKDSEKSGREFDRFCDVPDPVNGSRQLKATKKALQVEYNSQRLTEIGNLVHKKGFQSKASWKDVSSGDGLYQSQQGGCKGAHSLLSDSRESSQGLFKVPGHHGQEDGYGDCKGAKEESEGNRRSELTKRMKINGSIYLSAGKGGHPSLASQQLGSRERHDDLPKQKRQRQGGNNRNIVMETGSDAVKGTNVSKGASLHLLPPKALNQSLNKVPSRCKPVVADPKVAPVPGIRLRERSGLTSKCSISEGVKETLDFAGPKSLAQIKAEKMAARKSTSEVTGSLHFSSVMSESASTVGKRTSAVPADAGASNHNLHRLSASTIKKDNGLKQNEAANSEGSEGHIDSAGREGQINSLSKRKREEELGIYKTETQGSPILAHVSALSSCREIEDGEFNGDDECNINDGPDDCTVVPSDEDVEVMSPSRLQSSSEEAQEDDALEFEVNSSEEDGSKLDSEMEESVYAVEDYEIDDDDEDDFAKKLARFFGSSSNE